MKRALLAPLLLILPLAAVACGDDDDADTRGVGDAEVTATATRTAVAPATATRTPTATTRTPTATPTGTGAGGGGAASLGVTLDEFTIDLGNESIEPGRTTFSVENEGAIVHNLIVIDTDQAADALPVQNAQVNLDRLTVVVRTQEEIPPGATAQVTDNLAAGRYILICNVIGHYQAGMRTTLEVEQR